MDYKELSNKIFGIDKDVRFVAFIRKSGKLIEWSVQEGVEPIGSEKERQKWFEQVAMRAQMYEMFNRVLGKIRMAYVEKERIKQLTFYLSDIVVFVTLNPAVNGLRAIKIASSISKLLESNEAN